MSGDIKVDRLLEIFYRAMKGEAISAQKLAQEYGVSSRRALDVFLEWRDA